jgi:Cof subfamily protein (haloacid dehalogenase superfamily)
MVAIDLDGTLLSPDGTVSPRAKEAVHKALRAGLLVCFATGRNYTESQTILDAVEHYSTAVFVGGAMVIDTRHRRTLHRMGMEPQLARDVCRLIESMGHAALALQDTQAAGVDYLVTADVELNDATGQWMEVTAAAVQRVSGLDTHRHEHTIRVGIVAPQDETVRVRQALERHFAERVLCQSLYVPAYAVEVLEVFDPAVNKWEGILHVARHHGIAPEQIVAIGDDVNDIAMVSQAGLGVAMGNARPEVIAVAKRVIGANHEDGLAEFLEELISTHAVEPEEASPELRAN